MLQDRTQQSKRKCNWEGGSIGTRGSTCQRRGGGPVECGHDPSDAQTGTHTHSGDADTTQHQSWRAAVREMHSRAAADLPAMQTEKDMRQSRANMG
jgi:hypothetical protein